MTAELDALLLATKGHVMSKEEMAAQRLSWVVGEMLLSFPEMTREEAVRIYEQAVEGGCHEQSSR